MRSKVRRPHLFIENVRDVDAWFESCLKVHPRAIERKWNHPLWRYPVEQWRDYFWEYKFNLRDKLHSEGVEIILVNIFNKTTYGEFARKCALPCPDHLVNRTLPNIDRYGRRFVSLPPAIGNPLVTNEFTNALNPLLGGY
jgi:hypothetical protein